MSSQVGGTQSTEKLSYSIPEECPLELKNNGQTTHSLIVTETQQSLDNVLCIKEYSNLCRLIKVLAYVLRAVKLFKGVSLQLRNKSLTLIPAELASAEKLLITHTQSTLVVDRNFPSLKKQLDLFVDGHGLWRCGGRLTNADIPYSTKHPVLLPRDHHFTVLIVRDAHERVAHDGVRETLTEIRQKFWIVKGRSLVKSIIHRCVLCRRFEGAPFRGPPPPPLPDFRVKKKPPFSYTGVDFAGPFHVRSFGLTNSDKVWICLFTCLVVRAVHLETVTDLSTETFIRCLKRFAARRGIPLMFLSDNGKTFKAAARFIKAVFKEDIVQNQLSGRGIEWTFNVEKAPWWGGAFERLVRSTKRCLKKMMGRARFSLDELNTALVEVEAIINSRPLTYLSSSDLGEPLTPSHLLTGRRILSVPDRLGYSHDPEDEEFIANTSSSDLKERARRLNNALNYFWVRWRDEYLIELRDVHRYAGQTNAQHSTIKVGDVVIIHEESLPRGFWKLARVEKVVCG